MKQEAVDARGRFPRAVAWSALAINAIVILQGAVVRITGSGAGCGRDWPRCQGEFVPLNHDAAAWVEYSHRLLSGVALLAGVWLVWTAVRQRRGRPGFLPCAVAAGIFLLIEALIGAGTVLSGLTGDNVSMARGLLVAFHLLNSLMLMGALSLSVLYASPGTAWPPSLQGQNWIAFVMALGMLGMLALMFTGGIAAMGNTMFPPESLQEGWVEDFSRDSHPLVRLRLLHPSLAIGIGVYLWVILGLSSWARPSRPARPFRLALLVAFAVQLVVGVANLALLGPMSLQLLHLALAVLIFALWTVVTWLILCVPAARPVPTLAVEESGQGAVA